MVEVLIRKYNEERDVKMVGKLEKSCENIKQGDDDERVSIFSSITGDPLRRIRLYPVHVAELRDSGELVGIVRGCIKLVGLGVTNVRLGCILGLRVSSMHRRMGIGSKLVKSAEEWLIGKGAQYILIATLKNNVASTNLFASRFGYTNFASLVIFVHRIEQQLPHQLAKEDTIIKVEKLQTEQAISLYNDKLRGSNKNVMFPADFDAILKENLTLGTWISYFKPNENDDDDDDARLNTSSLESWVVFSIWNSCQSDNDHNHKSVNKIFQSTLNRARNKIFPCLRLPISESPQMAPAPSSSPPFAGFLLVYGLYGEGRRLREVIDSVWRFLMKLAEDVRDCKAIITELGVSDPLQEHVPRDNSCVSCVDDFWYLKRVAEGVVGGGDDDDERGDDLFGEHAGNVIVDPRDF
ncbi:Probable N-acetyltransferase HLS1-like [Linum grandiflorum]